MTAAYATMVAMLHGAARQIRENNTLLGQLDSVGGDGDHGPTMLRVMAQMEKAIEADGAHELPGLLKAIGWAIMGVDGGATGPLLGSLFMGMAEPALAAMFGAGLAKVRRQTKAQPGDKTMIDALAPAVEALQSAADEGADVPTALGRAAVAATVGAAATTQMMAKFGRAKNIREKTIGSPDAGATSISFMFKGFLEGVTSD